MHPVSVVCAGGVQGSRGGWVGGYGVKTVVVVELQHSVAYGD